MAGTADDSTPTDALPENPGQAPIKSRLTKVQPTQEAAASERSASEKKPASKAF